MLKGTRLDQVDSLEMNGLRFQSDSLTRANQQDELKLSLHDAANITRLHKGDSIVAYITLKDDRVLDLKTEVEAPRPDEL